MRHSSEGTGTPRRLRITVVLAALVLITWGEGTVGATATATASATDPGARLDSLRTRVAELDERRPAPLGGAGAARRVPAASTAEAVRPALEQRFGARFAGVWDRPTAAGWTTVVALVDPSEQDRRVAARVTGATTQVVVADQSLAELDSLEANVVAELERLGVASYAVGVDVPTNSLSVYLDEQATVTGDGAEWILDMASRAEIVVQSTEIGVQDYPNPDWAGQRVYVAVNANSFSSCTTGLAMRNALGNFMTTAAHCSPADGRAVHASSGDGTAVIGARVSTIVGWRGAGNVAGDFAAFYHAPAAGVIYGTNRAVKGGRDPQWLEQNVCFRGATSAAEKCAGVSDVNLTVAVLDDYGVRRTYKSFCIDFGTRQGGLRGDSGAAMYQATAPGEANARGILWGFMGSKTCGTPISAVTSTYQASILVK